MQTQIPPARARTKEALGRRDELARLFDLSRDVLVITDSREAISVLAGYVRHIGLSEQRTLIVVLPSTINPASQGGKVFACRA